MSVAAQGAGSSPDRGRLQVPRRARVLAALVAGLALVVGQAQPAWSAPPATAATAAETRDVADAGDLPLALVPNAGQHDPEVRFHAEVGDHAFFFTRDRVVMSLTDGADHGVVLALRFLDPDPHVEPVGQGAAGVVNHLRGADPARWRTGLPSFSGVVYPDLWPGVDMAFHAGDGELKYELVVRPGGRVGDIRLGYEGADGLALDASGALLIDTPVGVLADSAPVSYQDVGGRRVAVGSRVVLGDADEYGFAVDAYDHGRTLVIDPALQYSTFLGGASMDAAHDMAVTAGGEVVVVGATQSTDFPTTVGAFDPTRNGGVMDAFVARVSADGSRLVYATYLGGTPTPNRRGATDETERARGVAVDRDGNAYVVGQTSSGDFPTTSGAFQPNLKVGENQATDAFVTKLGPTGGMVWSTFLGGELGSDDGRAVAVDGTGHAYVGGSTFASDFPTTAGAFDRVQHGGEDVYVTKLHPTGSSLVYSTILGGTDNELLDGIAVGSDGSAYASGSTRSVDFPSTPGAFQPAHSGGGFADLFEVFVTRLAPDGSALRYSTFLGGTRVDRGGRVTVDGSGNAHVLVATLSPEFPTTAGAYDPVFTPTSESGVVKLDASGSALVYSTFLGGGSAAAIALDDGGNAWLAGGQAAGAPVVGGQPNCGGQDVWLARLDATGATLPFATYLGGTQNDGATGIGRDAAGSTYVAGTTLSADFPTTAGAWDRVWAGDTSTFWGDAFVAKLSAADGPVGPGCPAPALSSLSVSPTSVTGGETATGTVTLGAAAPEGGTSVTLASGSTVATVPGSVTVPAGAASATFTVSTTAVTTDTSVALSATLGDVTRTTTLTVLAPAATVSLSALTLDPTSVVGGSASTGTVTLSGAAPSGGALVTLDSSNTAVATVPPDVTVAAGATSATFTVTTLPQQFDASSAISGRYGGAQRSAILSVTPGPTTTTTTFTGQIGRNGTVTHPLAVGAGTVSMTLSWPESRADLDLRVRDAGGAVVFSDTGSLRPKTGSFSVTVAGDHRFEITNTTRRGTDYTLSVTHPPASTTTPSDTTSPTVSITSPTGGSTVSGTVTITASASDDVGVAEVRFFVDGARIGTDTGAPYTAAWDTTTVADGDRVLTAQAVDTSGNLRTSTAVTVTVSNAVAPTVTLASVELTPSTVIGGEGSTGTVTLSGAAPSGGATVSLGTSDAAVATVPSSVVVPAGSTSTTFAVSTSAVTTERSVTVSGTHGGTTRSAVLTVAPAPPTTLAAPTLLAPAEDARWAPGVSQTFDWSDVSAAASYTLQVSTSSAFTSVELTRTVTASRVDLSFPSEGDRFWRVRANDSAGAPGAWSATRSFRIKD